MMQDHILNIEGIYPGTVIASLPKNDLFARLKFLLPFIVAKQDTYKILTEQEALDILEEVINFPDRSVEEVHRFAFTHTSVCKNFSLSGASVQTYHPSQMYSSITIQLCDSKVLAVLVNRIDHSPSHLEKVLAQPEQTDLLNDLKVKKFKFNFARNKFSEKYLDPDEVKKWKQDLIQQCKDFRNNKAIDFCSS